MTKYNVPESPFTIPGSSGRGDFYEKRDVYTARAFYVSQLHKNFNTRKYNAGRAGCTKFGRAQVQGPRERGQDKHRNVRWRTHSIIRVERVPVLRPVALNSSPVSRVSREDRERRILETADMCTRILLRVFLPCDIAGMQIGSSFRFRASPRCRICFYVRFHPRVSNRPPRTFLLHFEALPIATFPFTNTRSMISPSFYAHEKQTPFRTHVVSCRRRRFYCHTH